MFMAEGFLSILCFSSRAVIINSMSWYLVHFCMPPRRRDRLMALQFQKVCFTVSESWRLQAWELVITLGFTQGTKALQFYTFSLRKL